MQKNISRIFVLIIFYAAMVNAKVIFVAPTGLDANTGTLESPFKTITKALTVFANGDTIYLRGGSYIIPSAVSINISGNLLKYNYLFAYPGELPILDCSAQPVGSSYRGIYLRGSYWHVRGIHIKGAGDNGMNVSGSSNRIENCAFYENRDTGLQLSGGASNNRIINCDSYFNRDPDEGDADGFAPKLDCGSGNYFYGCRAWQNSDDGWDGYLRPANDITTTIEASWCFANGYRKDGTASTGNGNGYKMGGSDDKTLQHNMILIRCLAFDNRVKGFDQNNNKGSMTLLNCTGYRNGTNYSVSQALATGKTLTIKNCAVLGSTGSVGSFAIQAKNSWLAPFPGAAASDFQNTDTTGVRGPRTPEGALPDLGFMKLSATSRLIDAGIDVGIPFTGSAPDMGCFEYGMINSVEKQQSQPAAYVLSANYPNPFNPSTTILYQLTEPANVKLDIYDMLGREVAELVNTHQAAGEYKIRFDGVGLPSGTYIYRLLVNGNSMQRPMSLVK